MIKQNAVLEISKKNIIYNYKYFQNLVKNNICAAVIKSNAYGLGADKVYEILIKNDCKHFFVATCNEGLELRKKFKKGNIYVLNGLESNNLKLFKQYKLIPIISNLYDLKFVIKKTIKYGIQINTGINRLGLNYNEYKNIPFEDENLVLILSHLASSDEKENLYNKTQLNKFNHIIKMNKNKKILFSLANSFGSILSSEYFIDMIRPGIALYGGHFNKKTLKENIRSVVKLKAKILQIKQLNKNEYVGYNQTYKTRIKTWVAIIGIGYGDGLKRILSNQGNVYFEDKTYKIIGRISMDSIVIDITKNFKIFKVGKYVEVINEKNGIDKLAINCKTISHEILTSLTSRVERKFV